MKRSILAAMATIAIPGIAAVASTPAARALEAERATRACIAASGFGAARVTRQPAMFDDRLHLDGLLVSGRPRQSWLHGRLMTKLCLYDRQTRQAQAVAAPGWPQPLR